MVHYTLMLAEQKLTQDDQPVNASAWCVVKIIRTYFSSSSRKLCCKSADQ